MTRIEEKRDAYNALIRDGATHPALNVETAWLNLVMAILDIEHDRLRARFPVLLNDGRYWAVSEPFYDPPVKP